MQVQKLYVPRPSQSLAQPRPRQPGRVWVNTTSPKRNRTVAEMCARGARIDNPDHLIRIHYAAR